MRFENAVAYSTQIVFGYLSVYRPVPPADSPPSDVTNTCTFNTATEDVLAELWLSAACGPITCLSVVVSRRMGVRKQKDSEVLMRAIESADAELSQVRFTELR